MRTKFWKTLRVALLALVALALATACDLGADDDDDDEEEAETLTQIKGSLYIDNIRFADADGTILGTFDSFENVGDDGVYCGGSSVDVWGSLLAAASSWGGQAVAPASSSLYATDGSYSLLIPVDITISATDADNYLWVGVNWATATAGGILLPDALAANWPGAAKILFDYCWVPDEDYEVSLQMDASVEWNDAAWSLSSSAYYGANSTGSSADLVANAASAGEIELDYAVYAGADQCYEIGFGFHYVGAVE